MTRLRTVIIAFALGAAVAGVLASDAVTVGIGMRTPERAAAPPQSAPDPSNFVEIKWPFPRDQWGDGRAFRCPAAECGIEVSLYLRPKIGFCNCDTGVADEAELDRVIDIELFSPNYFGLTHGDEIQVGKMRGLSRIYQVDIPYQTPPRPILGMAFNQDCDVMVATVVAPLEHMPSAERHVLMFLNSEPFLKWAKAQFGV
jgi:hypothetical protein